MRNLLQDLSSVAGDMRIVLSAFLAHVFNDNSNNGIDRDRERVVIVVSYDCRNIEYLNIPSVFGNKRIRRLLPDKVRSAHPPRIFYKLVKPISLRICNYSRLLSSLSLSDISNISTSACICSSKPDFIYAPFGHIVTGDLNVIDDVHLRNVMARGVKFRIPQFFAVE